jgi:hypothetical protein
MFIFQKIRFGVSSLVFLSMLYFSSMASAQVMIVSARLDTTRAMIGDQLKLHIRVEKPLRTRVTFPMLHDTLAGKIEIVKKWPVDSVLNQPGRLILSQDLLLTVFDTGFFEIPSLPFAFNDGQIKDTLRTQPVSFEILSLPVDTTIRDIRANMRAPINAAELMPYALALIVLVLVIYLVVYWIRKRRRVETKVPAEVLNEPADVIALRELELLREDKPWDRKQIKPYYIRLTEILRIYIERRYGITALEQTTDEILADLKKSTVPDSSLERLSPILKLADLVKFAKVIPDQEENISQLDEAVEFVRETARPVDELKQESTYEHDPMQSNVVS